MPAPSVREHLGSLVGETISTVTGRPNRIVRVDATSVIVGTQRSPDGEQVLLAEIQAVVDRVFAGEEVRLDPGSVGFRSAFIGAALSSMEAVEVVRKPGRARLRSGFDEPHSEVEAFLRAREETLEDPMLGRRFRIIATPPGEVTYQQVGRHRPPTKTVSTETLQRILTVVRDRTTERRTFQVAIAPRFYAEHGHFVDAVIHAIAPRLFRDSFDGVMPDEQAALGRDDESADSVTEQPTVRDDQRRDRAPRRLLGTPYQVPMSQRVSRSATHFPQTRTSSSAGREVTPVFRIGSPERWRRPAWCRFLRPAAILHSTWPGGTDRISAWPRSRA